ncbi:MAG: restriction endonuclease [Polaribacter sp.]|nr:restriction endonuclease [Polaribacter sp.]MDG1812011.1 restriction endonuclease [Polaribacter sp.]MDG1994599.1 restriction endonuclease [Polaribacter sp.]
MEKSIYIHKRNNKKELFSFEKLKKSLFAAGANNDLVKVIVSKIQSEVYNGITSDIIYKKAFTFLKKHHRTSASRYSLKRAIFDLGPTGYPFEKLVGALLREKGYKTQVSVILEGICVTHEIDVLAEKEGNIFAIECKFHSDSRKISGVKIPLYINSRFLDVQEKWNSNTKNQTHLTQGWLVTNTRFSEDAINYGKCVDLNLLSWDYPKNNGLKANIDAYALYPITTLTTLSKKEKHLLIEANIVLVKELQAASREMKHIGLSDLRINRVLDETKNMCPLK